MVRFLTLFARATSLSGCGRFFDMVSDKKWQVYDEVPLSCFRTRLSWIFFQLMEFGFHGSNQKLVFCIGGNVG